MTSIWLQLREDQERALQIVIERAAEENNTLLFRPRLTVCGLPDGNLAALDAAAIPNTADCPQQRQQHRWRS